MEQRTAFHAFLVAQKSIYVCDAHVAADLSACDGDYGKSELPFDLSPDVRGRVEAQN
jgi:hypothetical protein